MKYEEFKAKPLGISLLEGTEKRAKKKSTPKKEESLEPTNPATVQSTIGSYDSLVKAIKENLGMAEKHGLIKAAKSNKGIVNLLTIYDAVPADVLLAITEDVPGVKVMPVPPNASRDMGKYWIVAET